MRENIRFLVFWARLTSLRIMFSWPSYFFKLRKQRHRDAKKLPQRHPGLNSRVYTGLIYLYQFIVGKNESGSLPHIICENQAKCEKSKIMKI
jgi:hypothetical protein